MKMFLNISGLSHSLLRNIFLVILAGILTVSIIFLADYHRKEKASANPDPYLGESHFRIGKDRPLSAMEWYENTDVFASGILRNENFRVRFQVYNETDETKNWIPRLEYLELGSSWAEIPGASGSLPFFISYTSQFLHGDNITISNFALGIGPSTPLDGRAYCTTPSANITIEAFSYTEIEFNIQANANAESYTPYTFRITDAGTTFSSYNNHAVISVWEVGNTESPHYGYDSITNKCGSCHRVHSAIGDKLRNTWPEESLCITCHDGSGSGTDVAIQFTSKHYQHPISDNEGAHTTQEGYYNWLPATNRHVECEDCHNPHGSQTGISTPGFGDLSRTIENTWGVEVTNPAAGWTGLTSGDYTRISAVTAEYQLCMKCHSSYAYDSTPPLSHSGGIVETDQAMEFNVNNASYHWVEIDKAAIAGDTPRTNSITRNMSFTPGSAMTNSSPLNCSDCHASDVDTEARGVHGSDEAYLLRGTWSDTTNGTEYSLCFQCHDENVYGPGGSYEPGMTNFSGFYRRFANTDPAPNLHVYHWTRIGVYGCQNCHSAVPHGGWNRALLVEMDDPAPYSNGSLLRVYNWAPGGGWIWLDCNFSPCH